MTNNWRGMDDDNLADEAQTGLRGQGALGEAMRRLRVSMDWYSRWLLGLTVILTVLTALLVYKEFRP